MILPEHKHIEPEIETTEYYVQGGITGDYTFYLIDDTKKLKWKQEQMDNLIREMGITLNLLLKRKNK